MEFVTQPILKSAAPVSLELHSTSSITLALVQMVSMKIMELATNVLLNVVLVKLPQLVILVLMLTEILTTIALVLLDSMMLELINVPNVIQAVPLAQVLLPV